LVGVLGGMGPWATLDFLQKILKATPACRDQDHVPVLVSNIPQIPDRTAAYGGEGESPLDALIANGQRLKAGGASVLVMPCNTAHLWFDDLESALATPMLHIVDSALRELQPTGTKISTVGILGTDATLASGLYPNRALAVGAAVRWVQPTAREMIELLMPGIRLVKAGRLDEGREHLNAVARSLVRRGAQALVMACTELPLVLDNSIDGIAAVDPTSALARAVVHLSKHGSDAPGFASRR
jgi:aspartate racemase